MICEYLEDVFPAANPLRPTDPATRAEMRVWTKWVDEYFCWCVSTIGWERMIGPMARAYSDAEFEEKVARIPVPEQQTKWRNARAGFDKAVLAEEMRKIGVCVRRLDDRLANSEWLTGDQYTLADICNFAIAAGMQFGFPEFVNAQDTPHLLRWINRIAARPATQRMYAEVPSEFAKPQS